MVDCQNHAALLAKLADDHIVPRPTESMRMRYDLFVWDETMPASSHLLYCTSDLEYSTNYQDIEDSLDTLYRDTGLYFP